MSRFFSHEPIKDVKVSDLDVINGIVTGVENIQAEIARLQEINPSNDKDAALGVIAKLHGNIMNIMNPEEPAQKTTFTGSSNRG